MAYTMLRNKAVSRNDTKNSLEQAALAFIREDCEGFALTPIKLRISVTGILILRAPA